MKFLFFDTETTGLPRDKRVPAKDTAGNWPDIVSIAWMILDEDRKLLKARYLIVKPDGWDIPEDSVAIHGITQEKASKEGVHLRPLLEEFQKDVLNSNYVVAHNMNFDKNVVENAAIWRAYRDPYKGVFRWTTCFCTAEIGKDLLKIPFPDGRGFKFPRLADLYKFATKKEPSVELHNALFDTMLLAELFYHLPIAKAVIGKNEGARAPAGVLSLSLADASQNV